MKKVAIEFVLNLAIWFFGVLWVAHPVNDWTKFVLMWMAFAILMTIFTFAIDKPLYSLFEKKFLKGKS